MSIAFLYAGQGSQKVGMGLDFYYEYSEYRDFIDSLNVGIDVKKLMHKGPIEELSLTENTQCCMAAFAAGVTMLLRKNNIVPDKAMGLSLGEYGALYAANVFSAEEYVKLTAFRGRKMMEAAKGIKCAMSAILGMKSEDVKKVCDAYDGEGFVTVANYNCPGQYVICGDEEAVTNVEALLKENGAKRCVRLNVSGPFHTKYMEPAGEALKDYFSKMTLNKPEIPIVLNVTGDYLKDESISDVLVRQVQNSVRLEDGLRKLITDDVDTYIEIGPGNAVSGFLKKTAKDMGKEVKVMSIDSVEDFKKVIGEING